MKPFFKKLRDAEIAIAAAFLLTTVFVIFVSALTRTLGHPINWAWDIALLLFTWSAFLGGDIAYREEKFVNVDVFLVKMPKKLQKPLELCVYLIIFVFLSSMIYLGSIQSVKTWHRTFQGIPSLSYTWVTLSMPVCSFLMLISTVMKIYKKFIKNSKNPTEVKSAS